MMVRDRIWLLSVIISAACAVPMLALAQSERLPGGIEFPTIAFRIEFLIEN